MILLLRFTQNAHHQQPTLGIILFQRYNLNTHYKQTYVGHDMVPLIHSEYSLYTKLLWAWYCSYNSLTIRTINKPTSGITLFLQFTQNIHYKQTYVGHDIAPPIHSSYSLKTNLRWAWYCSSIALRVLTINNLRWAWYCSYHAIRILTINMNLLHIRRAWFGS